MHRFIFVLTLVQAGKCICSKSVDVPIKIIEWFPPDITGVKQPISPEFSWLYLQKKEHLLFNLDVVNLEKTKSKINVDDLINLTSFHLYTENNKNTSQQIIIENLESIKNSNWNPTKLTKIIIHGYVATYKDEYIQIMKDKLLALGESVNVILFDWGPIANYNYPKSASLTDKVGAVCSQLIDFLCQNAGAQSNQFHIIGHSLGAHIAGFAGKYTTVGVVGRVTGLDPALPGFITEGRDGRLDSSDAEFVDCIHTCGGLISFRAPICHADYYPNGGSNPQPGCTGFFQSAGCSHSRAHELFTESIVRGHTFPALTCSDLPNKDSVKCIEQGAVMGYPAKSRFKGIFYTITNQVAPYAPNVTYIFQ